MAGTDGRRRAGVWGAVVGLAAAGAAAGIALERYLVRQRRNNHTEEDPYAGEPFGELTADGELTVTTEEGVDLQVDILDAAGVAGSPDGADPELTVLFVHGFCLDMGTFHFQRRGLAQVRHPRLRMVFYDQPGHGRSGRLAVGEYDLASLGRALRQVLEAAAPTGPVVLVGHSMGGMTIMSLAEQFPELFGDRVVGVALISTSAGRLDEVTFGLPDLLSRVRRPLLPLVTRAGQLTPGMLDRARRASTDLAWLMTRRYGFGGERPSPSLVSYVEKMNSMTSMEVIAGYLRTLFDHVRYTALQALEGVEVLVLTGEKDMITPVAHSEEISRHLAHAELVVVPDAGHVVLLEYGDVVNEHLATWLQRAGRAATRAAAKPVKAPRRLTKRIPPRDRDQPGRQEAGPQEELD